MLSTPRTPITRARSTRCPARLACSLRKTRQSSRPNADTPYCMFWMDLRAEPLVLTVPELEPERFYHFQLIDLYTHNFAYVGTLTTGNGAGKYLIAGPDWDGEKPEGVTRCDPERNDLHFQRHPDPTLRPRRLTESQGDPRQLRSAAAQRLSGRRPSGGRARSRFPQMGRRFPV